MVGGWAAGVACCGYINCWCYGVIVEQRWLANYTRMPTAHKLGQRPKQYGLLIERSPLGNLIYRLLRHGLGRTSPRAWACQRAWAFSSPRRSRSCGARALNSNGREFVAWGKRSTNGMGQAPKQDAMAANKIGVWLIAHGA